MLWGNGDEAINKAGTKADLSSSSAKKIYEAYNSLVQTPNGMGAGSKEETGATWTAPFQNGKVGVMQYPYTAVSALFKDSPFDIGVAPIPGVDGGSSTFLGGDAIGVSKSSKHAAQAWNFLSWLMTDKAQQKVFADNNDTASNLTVLKNGYKDADPRTIIANDTIQDGQTPIATNYNEAFNAAGSPWQLLIQNAIWGNGSKVAADNDAITAVLAG
jgi:multiple sugar transport system substrate-binding protein